MSVVIFGFFFWWCVFGLNSRLLVFWVGVYGWGGGVGFLVWLGMLGGCWLFFNVVLFGSGVFFVWGFFGLFRVGGGVGFGGVGGRGVCFLVFGFFVWVFFCSGAGRFFFVLFGVLGGLLGCVGGGLVVVGGFRGGWLGCFVFFFFLGGVRGVCLVGVCFGVMVGGVVLFFFLRY